MLLATFQPIFTDEEIEIGKKLGTTITNTDFSAPIWCYPANDLGTLFASMKLSAPIRPQMFTIFETDNYKRIDKRKWLEYQIQNRKFDNMLFTSNLPDIECEFLTEASNLENSQNKITISICGIGEMIEKKEIQMFSDKQCVTPKEEHTKIILESIDHMIDKLIKLDIDLPYESPIDENGNDFTECLTCMNIMRIAFTYYLMPVMWAMITNKENPGIYVTTLKNAIEISETIYDDFASWIESCETPFNKEHFIEYHEKLKKLPVTNEIILNTMCTNPWYKPKRNDPCMCGSGKKYKNCCGKL